MKRKVFVTVASAALLVTFALPCRAAKDSSDLLREGLLGAGAGAVGGAASGARGGDIWKGALAGAGVNIVGGALLDSISGEKVRSAEPVQRMPSQDAYGVGYQDGFNNGFKAGYTQGYKDGVQESLRGQ